MLGNNYNHRPYQKRVIIRIVCKNKVSEIVSQGTTQIGKDYPVIAMIDSNIYKR